MRFTGSGQWSCMSWTIAEEAAPAYHARMEPLGWCEPRRELWCKMPADQGCRRVYPMAELGVPGQGPLTGLRQHRGAFRRGRAGPRLKGKGKGKGEGKGYSPGLDITDGHCLWARHGSAVWSWRWRCRWILERYERVQAFTTRIKQHPCGSAAISLATALVAYENHRWNVRQQTRSRPVCDDRGLTLQAARVPRAASR